MEECISPLILVLSREIIKLNCVSIIVLVDHFIHCLLCSKCLQKQKSKPTVLSFPINWSKNDIVVFQRGKTFMRTILDNWYIFYIKRIQYLKFTQLGAHKNCVFIALSRCICSMVKPSCCISCWSVLFPSVVPGRLETDFNVKSLFSCFGNVITISCNKRNTNEQSEKFIEITGHG